MRATRSAARVTLETMKALQRWLAPLLVVAAGCRNGAPHVVPLEEAAPAVATPRAAEPSSAGPGERPSPEVPQPGAEAERSGPGIPELDAPPPLAPVQDDGLASSGVPGYQRAGCSPLGPYEDEYLAAPGYDPTACSGSQRMANVVVGAIDGSGGGRLPSKPRRIRCWPLSERERARSTYSSAFAELTACPTQRGGHGVQLPADAPISVGTCADGTRFLREGYLTRHRTRYYGGELLLGISLFHGVGKGGACRGEVNCEVVREEGLCGTTPDKPRNFAPRRGPAVP